MRRDSRYPEDTVPAYSFQTRLDLAIPVSALTKQMTCLRWQHFDITELLM